MSPASGDALAAAGVADQGVGEQDKDKSPDSAAAAADQQELSRLRAQLALRGHYLHCAGSGFIVTCAGWMTELGDLASLRAFVARIGGAA